jgi:MarR family transcriptional regulator, organic hydroperoxide resistance regulator
VSRFSSILPAVAVAAKMAQVSPAREAWALMFELFAQQKPRHIAIAAEFDLSPMQAFALRLIEPGTPLAMCDLAEALHCDASNVTGIVDRLEARELIARRGADHDRRVKMLVVTEQGAALRDRLLARISEPPPPIAALSAADQRSLRDILRRALD